MAEPALQKNDVDWNGETRPFDFRISPSLPQLHFIFLSPFVLVVSPWYNRTGWLGVKHQFTYSLTYFVLVSLKSMFVTFKCLMIGLFLHAAQLSCSGLNAFRCKYEQTLFEVNHMPQSFDFVTVLFTKHHTRHLMFDEEWKNLKLMIMEYEYYKGRISASRKSRITGKQWFH